MLSGKEINGEKKIITLIRDISDSHDLKKHQNREKEENTRISII